jgi:hypothetical protein
MVQVVTVCQLQVMVMIHVELIVLAGQAHVVNYLGIRLSSMLNLILLIIFPGV